MTDLKIQTCNQPSVGMRFQRDDDRWIHQFVLISNGEELPLLSSVEGTANDIWPDSPPLQDASHHALGGGEAILCVGMAGKSHWSAAFSIENSDDPGQSDFIKCDLACLQKDDSEGVVLSDAKLLSTYAIDSHWKLESVSESQLKLSLGTNQVLIESISDDQIKSKLGVESNRLTITSTEMSKSSKVATRWGFRIRCVSRSRI